MKIATRVVDVYVDSSFLLKLYLGEQGSADVDAALRRPQGSTFVTGLTDVEIISSIHRRLTVADGITASQTYLANRLGGLYVELVLDAEVI